MSVSKTSCPPEDGPNTSAMSDKSPSRNSPDMFEDSQELMEVDTLPVGRFEASGETSSTAKKLKLAETWRGVSMIEIYQGPTPWSAPEFPVVSPAYNHTVLYHISRSNVPMDVKKPPVPQLGKDLWDREHVRMPCSPQSLYPVETKSGKTAIRNRWELINEALSQPIGNSHELETAILKYNHKYKKHWKFNALHTLFNDYLSEEETEYFFTSTLPAMIELALKLPQLIPSPIPLLRQHFNRSVSLSQQQIACLLANGFFSTFPRRNTNKAESEYSTYPNINFYRLFMSKSDSVLEKLKCICNYFRRVCKHVPCGVMTFTRKTVEPSKCPDWSESKDLIGSVPLHIDSNGTIETDGIGLLQVDFANKYLGGGVLGQGCVQEEIRFVICPELLVSMLFTEVLTPTEALVMIGCEQFNEYTGYADNFQWSGNHEDRTPLDSSGRKRCAIVAIDALPFRVSTHQYQLNFITRELNKAWVGYSAFVEPEQLGLSLPGVATGNWGCGAFRGSPHLKCLLQLMACCKARRPMVYYTFDDTRLRDSVINMYNFLSRQNITVGDLFKYLCQFCKSKASEDQLYPFILQLHKDSQRKPAQMLQKLTTVLKKPFISLKTFEEANKGGAESTVSTVNVLSEEDEITASMFANDDFPSLEVVTPDINITSNEERGDSPIDVEKALPKPNLRSANTSLVDKLTHLDETNSAPPQGSPTKRHGTLSFFETVSNETQNCSSVDHSKNNVTSLDNKIDKNVKAATKRTLKNEGKPQNSPCRISDYFQRLPKEK